MILDPVSTRAAYDQVAERYADQFVDELDRKPVDRALLALVADEVARAGGGAIADLGSGPGQIGAHLRDRGATVVAVDLAPNMVAIARRRLGLPAAAGSLTALPLATGSLAAATVFYTLIHLDDAGLEAAVAEIARVLRPGALLLASVHVGEEVHHRDEWWGHPVDLDFRFFPVGSLVEWLAAAGLDVEAVTERVPGPDETTRRAYVLARSPAPATATTEAASSRAPGTR
jgi:SAM-dependent methyltransferase